MVIKWINSPGKNARKSWNNKYCVFNAPLLVPSKNECYCKQKSHKSYINIMALY